MLSQEQDEQGRKRGGELHCCGQIEASFRIERTGLSGSEVSYRICQNHVYSIFERMLLTTKKDQAAPLQKRLRERRWGKVRSQKSPDGEAFYTVVWTR